MSRNTLCDRPRSMHMHTQWCRVGWRHQCWPRVDAGLSGNSSAANTSAAKPPMRLCLGACSISSEFILQSWRQRSCRERSRRRLWIPCRQWWSWWLEGSVETSTSDACCPVSPGWTGHPCPDRQSYRKYTGHMHSRSSGDRYRVLCPINIVVSVFALHWWMCASPLWQQFFHARQALPVSFSVHVTLHPSKTVPRCLSDFAPIDVVVSDFTTSTLLWTTLGNCGCAVTKLSLLVFWKKIPEGSALSFGDSQISF